MAETIAKYIRGTWANLGLLRKCLAFADDNCSTTFVNCGVMLKGNMCVQNSLIYWKIKHYLCSKPALFRSSTTYYTPDHAHNCAKLPISNQTTAGAQYKRPDFTLFSIWAPWFQAHWLSQLPNPLGRSNSARFVIAQRVDNQQVLWELRRRSEGSSRIYAQVFPAWRPMALDSG